MSKDLSVNGRKKLSTLQKDFSEKFSFLFLAFIETEDREKTINARSLDTSKTIMETRIKFSNDEISINGRTLVRNIEKYFFEELGIACQITIHNYSDQELYFPLGYFNEMSLTKANEWAEKQNCTEITAKKVVEFSGKNVF